MRTMKIGKDANHDNRKSTRKSPPSTCVETEMAGYKTRKTRVRDATANRRRNLRPILIRRDIFSICREFMRKKIKIKHEPPAPRNPIKQDRKNHRRDHSDYRS